jgi:hypothetical protein
MDRAGRGPRGGRAGGALAPPCATGSYGNAASKRSNSASIDASPLSVSAA